MHVCACAENQRRCHMKVPETRDHNNTCIIRREFANARARATIEPHTHTKIYCPRGCSAAGLYIVWSSESFLRFFHAGLTCIACLPPPPLPRAMAFCRRPARARPQRGEKRKTRARDGLVSRNTLTCTTFFFGFFSGSSKGHSFNAFLTFDMNHLFHDSRCCFFFYSYSKELKWRTFKHSENLYFFFY